MKKSLVLALVAVLVLSFASMAFAFTDADNSWAKVEIAKLVDLKVVNGMTASTFVPEGKVTRAEFAKLLVNAKGLALENPAKATFSDVATTAWYFPYVEAAAKAGLVSGTGNGKFAPTANVTRQEVAKMIVLAAGKTADTTKALNFDDKASISDWAKGYVAVAADLKLVQGYNNKFNPTANATRAEAAKLTYSELVYEGKIVPDVTVAADMMTEVNSDNLVIGGKTYDLIAGSEYLVGTQLVSKKALVENTHVKFTLNTAGNITKVVVDAPDYTNVKGEVTEVGEDATDVYVVIAGKKVYVDVKDADYYTASIDDKDVLTDDPTPKTIVLNKEYLIVYNSANYAKYSIRLASSNTSGNLDSKSEDKDGKYLIISGKKYYFKKDGSTYDVKVLDAASPTTFHVESPDTDFAALATGDRVEFETNSDSKITALKTSAVDLQGIAGTPIYTVSGATYTIYVPISEKTSKNYPSVTTYLTKTYTSAEDVAAIRDMINVDNNLKLDIAPNANLQKALDTDTKTYLGTTKINLFDIKRNTYVTAAIDKKGVVTKVNNFSAKAFGLVDDFTKVGDKVTTVTVNGTKYTYAGTSDKYISAVRGLVSTVNGTTGEVAIERGFFASATLNADGAIVSFNSLYDPTKVNGSFLAAKVTLVGKSGQVSKLSKVNTSGNVDAKEVIIPTDTIEVSVDVTGSSHYAWVTFNKKAGRANTTSISVNGGSDIQAAAVGSVLYVNGILPANVFDTMIIPIGTLSSYNDTWGVQNYGVGATVYAQNNVATSIFQK